MPPEDLSSLERMRRRLYQPAEIPQAQQHTLRQQAPQYQAPPPPAPPAAPKTSKTPFAVKFLFIAIAFFVVAGIATAGILYFGTRSVSTDQVDLRVDPVTSSIASGDTISLLISLENKNPTGLTDTRLTVDFPEGVQNPDVVTEPLIRFEDTLGDIPVGGVETRTVRAAIYGTENQTMTVPVTFEYKMVGNSATYQKKAEITITITSSPVSMTVTTLKETASGQPFSITVAVKSNDSKPLNDVAVLGVYPNGFTQSTASPTPTPGPLFKLGTLNPGEEKVITITGTLRGQENDERVFRFTTGNAGANALDLSVPYSSKDAVVTVTKPFLATSILLNRSEAEDVVAAPGSSVPATITWQNNLSSQITDARITVRLSGDALDLSSISSANGFYRSSDTSVVFSQETISTLRVLDPGASGSGSLNFRTKSASALAGMRNPTVNLSVSVTGRRIGESGVPQSVTSSMTRTLKVATDAVLSSRMVKTSGPFTNPGPLPPQPNVETMYTAILTLDNSLNSIADGAVTMTLPSYVRYTGVASPADGSIVYDPDTRTVTWRIGDIQPGTGSRQMAFQVAFLPSTSQSGDYPVLVSEQLFTGVDRFTGQQVSARVSPLDIRTTSDTGYKAEYGMVKK